MMLMLTLMMSMLIPMLYPLLLFPFMLSPLLFFSRLLWSLRSLRRCGPEPCPDARAWAPARGRVLPVSASRLVCRWPASADAGRVRTRIRSRNPRALFSG